MFNPIPQVFIEHNIIESLSYDFFPFRLLMTNIFPDITLLLAHAATLCLICPPSHFIGICFTNYMQLTCRTSLVAQKVKNLPTVRELWVQPLHQEDPLEKGNPLQYSCLENSMNRGAWWATVHGVAKSQT